MMKKLFLAANAVILASTSSISLCMLQKYTKKPKSVHTYNLKTKDQKQSGAPSSPNHFCLHVLKLNALEKNRYSIKFTQVYRRGNSLFELSTIPEQVVVIASHLDQKSRSNLQQTNHYFSDCVSLENMLHMFSTDEERYAYVTNNSSEDMDKRFRKNAQSLMIKADENNQLLTIATISGSISAPWGLIIDQARAQRKAEQTKQISDR